MRPGLSAPAFLHFQVFVQNELSMKSRYLSVRSSFWLLFYICIFILSRKHETAKMRKNRSSEKLPPVIISQQLVQNVMKWAVYFS